MERRHQMMADALLLACCMFLPVCTQAGGGARTSERVAGDDDTFSYIIMLDCSLHPETATLAVRYLRREKRWRQWLSGLPNGSDIRLHASLSSYGTWNDFLLVDISPPCCGKRRPDIVGSELNGASLILPGVGRVVVVHVVEDEWTTRSVRHTFAAETLADSASRWRYPRQYLRLPEPARWTGSGVRVAVLDNGVDPALLPQPNGEGSPDIRPNSIGWSVAVCNSFVPGVPCENPSDSHGTFTASLIAGNFWLGAGIRAGTVVGNRTASIGDAGTMPKSDERYLGVAPGAVVGMFRVFDGTRRSKTSWLVAALNAALQWRADVVSLAFGGTDNMDAVFTKKIRELAMANAVVVAAAGNAGPTLGTIDSPADQTEVLAVGSLGTFNHHIFPINVSECHANDTDKDSLGQRWVSHFSSRGPSTTEFPFGAGRVRPDILALGEYVLGVGRAMEVNEVGGAERPLGLQVQHGTSVATAIVAGVVALCVEALRAVGSGTAVNVALVKGLLIDTAVELVPNTENLRAVNELLTKGGEELTSRDARNWSSKQHGSSNDTWRATHDGIDMTYTLLTLRNILQFSRMSQGSGEVCPTCALSRIEQGAYKHGKRLDAFAFPKIVDATSDHHLLRGGGRLSAEPLRPCLLNWPYCEQPLFPSAAPLVFNLSLHDPRCESSCLNSTSLSVTISGAEGICGADKQCEPAFIGAAVAQRLMFVRAYASPSMTAYSGWLSLLVFSPLNASMVRMAPPYSPTFGAGEEYVLELFDLVVVTGFVHLAFSCAGNKDRAMSAGGKGDSEATSLITVPFKFPLVRRPSRLKRVGFDVNHQWFYPPDYVPGDDVEEERLPPHSRRGDALSSPRPVQCGVYECNSDHLYTNMAPLFLYLRRVLGLFVELPPPAPVLSGFYVIDDHRRADGTEADTSVTGLEQYYRSIGTLILFDLEIPLLKVERTAISNAVLYDNLHLLVVSEWYSKGIARTLAHRGSYLPDPPVLPSQSSECVPPFCSTWSFKRGTDLSPLKGLAALDGSAHVPTLNALLWDVSRGRLQLDTERVVSGELVLRSCSRKSNPPQLHSWSILSWMSRLWRGTMRYADSCEDRYLGEMRSAGMIRWPPTNRGYGQRHGPRGEQLEPQPHADSRSTMVCSIARSWATNLYFLRKVQDGNFDESSDADSGRCGGSVCPWNSDAIYPVSSSAFVPVFGFVGSLDDHSREDDTLDSKGCEGQGGTMCSSKRPEGRVAVFTDSDSFSNSPHYAGALFQLDLLMRDVSMLLSRSGAVDSGGHNLRRFFASFVDAEGREPSLSLSLMRSLLNFLHEGDTKDFMQGTDCRRIGQGDTENHLSATLFPSNTGGYGEESYRRSEEEEEKEAVLLVSRLLRAAPQRAAIAKKLSDVLFDWYVTKADPVVTSEAVADKDIDESRLMSGSSREELLWNHTNGREGFDEVFWSHVLGLSSLLLVLCTILCYGWTEGPANVFFCVFRVVVGSGGI